MALLAYQSISHVSASGGGITYAAPAASDTVPADDRGFMFFRNTDAVAKTITVPSPAGLDFGTATLPDQTYSLAAAIGAFQYIPMSPALGDANGLVTVNISLTTGVERAALRR